MKKYSLIKKIGVLGQIPRRRVSQEGVAPTVERWTPNPTVAGSNPVALIFYFNIFNYFPILLKNTNNFKCKRKGLIDNLSLFISNSIL